MADADKRSYTDPSRSGDGHLPIADASAASPENLLGLLKGPFDSDQASPMQPGVLLTSIGQIEHILIPAGWREGRQVNDATYFYREFLPSGDSKAKLCFFSRQRRLPEVIGRAFHDLLSEPVHELTSADFGSVSLVVRDQANPDDFTLDNACTEDLNSKRVLVVEGKYNEIQEAVRAVYVDADGITGSIIQEIYFQAPVKEFPNYLKEASAAFASILWK